MSNPRDQRDIFGPKKKKLSSRKKRIQSEPLLRKNKKSATTCSIPSYNINSRPSSSKNLKENPVHPNTDLKLNIYRSDEYLLLDVGIEQELGTLKGSNTKKYETLQQYINYEDLFQLSSQSLCDSILSVLDSSDYTTLLSSTVSKKPFEHKSIQTEYDPEFERWYKNKFETFFHRDFLENTEEFGRNVKLHCDGNRTNIKKRSKMMYFSDIKEEKETPTKVKHVSRTKMRNNRKKRTKPYEKKIKLSRYKFYYHKTKSPDKGTSQYWVSLDLMRSSQTFMKNDIENEEKLLQEDSIDISKIDLKLIETTFDEFDTEKQIIKISERFKQKGISKRPKENRENLQQIHFTKYLRLLGDMQALYEIEGDMLDKMTNDNMMRTTADDINYNKLMANQTIPISFHYDHKKHQELFKNVDCNIFKKCTLNVSPNDLITAMNDFDEIFYVNNRRCVATCSKKRTKKKVNQKISSNAFSITGKYSGINHDSLYPVHMTKVKALTKKLTEDVIILQSFRNIELELPSHSNIVDKLINDIPRPKVFDPKTLEPFTDYKIHFETDLKSVPDLSDFQFGFKWDSNVSQWPSTNTKTKFKSKIPVVHSCKNKVKKSMTKFRKLTQSDKPNTGNKFIVNSCTFNKLKFELPKLNLVDINAIRRTSHKITKEFKQILELVYINLNPHFRPMLNVAHMMSPIEIDCTSLTNGFKSCIELQYKRENYIMYSNLNFENLIDMSCYKPYQRTEKENFLDQNFLVSVLSENFLSQINSFMQSTLKNTLKCVMSTRPVPIAYEAEKEAINKLDNQEEKGINIDKKEKLIATPSQTGYNQNKKENTETKYYTILFRNNSNTNKATPSQTGYNQIQKEDTEAKYYTIIYSNNSNTKNTTPFPYYNSKSKMPNLSHMKQHNGESLYSPKNPKSHDKRDKITRRNETVSYVNERKSHFKFNQNVFRDCKYGHKNDGEFKSNVEHTEPYCTKLRIQETTSTDVVPASSISTSEIPGGLIKINNFKSVNVHHRGRNGFSTNREKQYCRDLPRLKTGGLYLKYKGKNKPARIGSQENNQKEDVNCNSILNLYLSLSSRTSVEGGGDNSTESSADINRLKYLGRSKNKSKRKVSPGKRKIQSSETTEDQITRTNNKVSCVNVRKSRFKFNQNVFRDCKYGHKKYCEFKKNVQHTEKTPYRVPFKNEPYCTKFKCQETSTDVVPASSKSTLETPDDLIKIHNFKSVNVHHRGRNDFSTSRDKQYCRDLPRPKTGGLYLKYKGKNKLARISSQENNQNEDLSLNCDSILNLYLSLSSRTSVEAGGDNSTESSANIRRLKYLGRSKNKSKRKVSPGKRKIQSSETTEGQIQDCLKRNAGDENKKTKYNSKIRDKVLKENDSILELYKTLTSDTSLLSFEKSYSINNNDRSKTRHGNKNKLALITKKSSEEFCGNDSILDLYLSL